MKLNFYGGAQTVTGSQVALSVNGKTMLLECGMFQGRRQETYEKNQHFFFDPNSIDALFLTHAHIDHSGNIPNLVKRGFKGPIYATPPTIDLCKLMLRDSAHLQEKDIEWVNKIRAKKNQPPVEPLYTMADAEACLRYFEKIDYRKPFRFAPGIDVMFRDGGHIFGSAGIAFNIVENGRNIDLGFTGDIGRSGVPILRDPDMLRDLDVLIMESTYGNRMHEPYHDMEEVLAQTIRETAQSGGKIIMPAFAIGRTQSLVYTLHKLFNQDRIPEIPIYVDSPLAIGATEVFRSYPQYFDRETGRLFLSNNDDPFAFGRLHYVKDVNESKQLNGLAYPHIIISASGMCEGGRILHHLRNNIGNPKVMVIFCGFAAQETLARKLMDGKKIVKIYGEEFEVKCKIKVLDGFSAHADRRDLLDYVKMSSPQKLKNLFLIHGEPDQALPLRDALQSMGYKNVEYPRLEETFTL